METAGVFCVTSGGECCGRSWRNNVGDDDSMPLVPV